MRGLHAVASVKDFGVSTDAYGLSGNIASSIRAKIKHHLRDLARRYHAAQRDLLDVPSRMIT